MEYRTLGGTGTVVSTLCLGTMTFGKESSEAVSHAQLDRFVEAGGNFIDTANVYSRGLSEEVIGRWPRPGPAYAISSSSPPRAAPLSHRRPAVRRSAPRTPPPS